MRNIPPAAPYAIPQAVYDLITKFEYPQLDPLFNPAVGAGGGGMAHWLIVSDSEPVAVQDKADFIVPSVNSAVLLQEAFDTIGQDVGSVSIWMAGVYDIEDDVTAPGNAWIRGLGFISDIGGGGG